MSIPLKILIVEDNPDDLLLLIRELDQGGFAPEYRRTETPEEYLAALAETDWQIILSDYSLPRFSGLAALQLLRERQSDIPFILISGTVGEEIAVQSMLAGASDYVLKGNLTRLIPAIRRELAAAETRRQRRLAEQQLIESRQLLELIYNNSSDLMGLFVFAEPNEFRLISVNNVTLRAATQVNLNLTSADVVGLTLSEVLHGLLQYTPEQIKRKYAEYLKAIQVRVPVETELVLNLTTEPRYYEELLIPLLNDDATKSLRYVLWSARDITQRRRDSEAKQLMDRQLQETQKLESLGLLAGGIAHDFNNLLSAILNHAGVALQSVTPDNPLFQHFELIQTASQIAAGLTRELLAYSGKGTVLNQVLDMNQLIQEMLPLFRTSLSVNTVLETSFASNLSHIQGDINQLRQVLLNLVVNANDSLHEQLGSVRITTQPWNKSAGPRTWLLPEQLPEQALLLEVTDTGCGLDEATKRRIFDPFFTMKSNGRGLGLSAVLGIIRAHQGNLAVTSQVNRGTTFSIVLPVSTSDVNLLPTASTAQLNKTGNAQKCILVIDDNELVRDSVAAVLKSKGYSVLLAADGQRGIEIYRQEYDLVSLVILDMTMPGLSGEDVFRKLRQIHPQLQIIITTGHSVEDISRKFLTQINVGFVQKASGPLQLLQEVQRLLNK